jgi:hypothetical protein
MVWNEEALVAAHTGQCQHNLALQTKDMIHVHRKRVLESQETLHNPSKNVFNSYRFVCLSCVCMSYNKFEHRQSI